MKTELSPLAQYLPLAQYQPAHGDFAIWTGWFATWYGFVTNYDQENGLVELVFEGLPYLLLTSTTDQQRQNLKTIALGIIQNGSKGGWAIQRHSAKHNAVVWYI